MALPFWVVAAYGLPSSAFAAVGIMVAVYLPGFYADRVGVPLSQIGAVTTALQVFDALTDPVLGFCSDRCTSRFGRRRPFLLVGGVLLAAACFAIFTPPRGLPEGQLIAYVAVVGLVLFLSWTVARVPWMSWGIELTSAHDEKTKVSFSRELAFVCGAVPATVMPTALEGVLTDEFQRMSVVAAFWAVATCAVTACCCAAVPDPPRGVADTAARENSQGYSEVCAFLRQFAGGRTAVTFYLNFVIYNTGLAVNALMFPFFVKHVLREEELMSTLLALYILLGVLCIPAWYFLSLRLEKRPLYMAAMAIQSLAVTIAFFGIGAGDLAGYVALVALSGTALGGAAVVKFSMLADVADVERLRSGGCRDEGKLFGLFDVSAKLAASGATAICFAVIDEAGYAEGAGTQSGAAQTAIRVCYALVPALTGWLAIAIIWWYPLDRAGHAAVLESLGEQGEAGGGSPETLGKPQFCVVHGAHEAFKE